MRKTGNWKKNEQIDPNMKREPEETIILPQETYRQVRAWRAENNSIGYIIACRQEDAPYMIWAVLATKLGSATHHPASKESNYDWELAQEAVDIVTSHKDLSLILMPLQSHATEELSTLDEKLLLSRFGFEYHLVTTPKTVKAFKANRGVGRIKPVQVAKIATYQVPEWVFQTANLLVAVQK
jgi:hypothetical protein